MSELTTKDYEEVLEDHRRLVRELDVLINGEAGAAKQASLCDIVAQIRAMKTPDPVDEALVDELIRASKNDGILGVRDNSLVVNDLRTRLLSRLGSVVPDRPGKYVMEVPVEVGYGPCANAPMLLKIPAQPIMYVDSIPGATFRKEAS